MDMLEINNSQIAYLQQFSLLFSMILMYNRETLLKSTSIFA